MKNLYQINDYECCCSCVASSEEEAMENAWNKCPNKKSYDELINSDDESDREIAYKCNLNCFKIDEVDGYKIIATK